MIDHLVLIVKDVAMSRQFFERALAPLGYHVEMSFPEGVGFGDAGKPEFWITSRGEPHVDFHLAFHCKHRAQVDEFYATAIAAGGRDNGSPGIREQYHPNYYGAFVFDPDGNNIEAVCHDPQG
jgi:catechol 2,3-dioxygenase-like lactoylglutathione lyase family enzyme